MGEAVEQIVSQRFVLLADANDLPLVDLQSQRINFKDLLAVFLEKHAVEAYPEAFGVDWRFDLVLDAIARRDLHKGKLS